MKCPKCQHENTAKARFCEECATPLTRSCGNCGSQVSATARFCLQCGHPLKAVEEDPRFASPKNYTPQHIADKILVSRAALEGERKLITVLFADIKGSMEVIADRDPEEVQKLLHAVLERMIEAVHRYEGTVNTVMGDGLMALFGAPLAHEDHAVRACYAALRMQENIARFSDEIQRSYGVPVMIRIGVNSGEIVISGIGNDLHMDYTVVGQTAHLAARMEQMAKPGSVLTTADTFRLVEGYLAMKPLGALPVKGLAHPVDVYEVTGAGAARSRLQAAAVRGLTRFVGRTVELQHLHRAQQLAAQGHGQVVTIVGQAGVGKSRLVHEFIHSPPTAEWLVLESNSTSYGHATPYLPITELLRHYFKLNVHDSVQSIREKVSGKILSLDPSLQEVILPVLDLLNALDDDHPFRSLDPIEHRQQTYQAVIRLLLSESKIQPVVAVFEDMPWYDSLSIGLLNELVVRAQDARLLLVVSCRPEYKDEWKGRPNYRQLRLNPLASESFAELLQALLGSDPSVETIKSFMIERASGNPFFLEEIARSLVDSAVLEGSRGKYRLARPFVSNEVPPTVQAVLAARIDKLPATEKRLLQEAAVIGHDFSFTLLQAISALAEDDLRALLDDLQAAEFLYTTQLFPDLQYTFTHALTHDVAYNELLQQRRRDTHGHVVEAMEKLYADRLGEHAERLAHHAVRGELKDKAVHYLHMAGGKAAARSALADARSCYEEALGILKDLPESQASLGRGFELRLDLRPVLRQLGEGRRQLEHLREAEIIATQLKDDRRRGQVCAFMTTVQSTLDELDEALDSGSRALGDRRAAARPAAAHRRHQLSRAGALLPRRLRARRRARHRQSRRAARGRDQQPFRHGGAGIDLRSRLAGDEPRRARPLLGSREIRGRGDPHRRADAACVQHRLGAFRRLHAASPQGRLGESAVAGRALAGDAAQRQRRRPSALGGCFFGLGDGGDRRRGRHARAASRKPRRCSSGRRARASSAIAAGPITPSAALCCGSASSTKRTTLRNAPSKPRRASPVSPPMPTICSAISRPMPSGSTTSAASATTATRWRWRNATACGRWSPTATSVSARSIAAPARLRMRSTITPPRPRCTATWICASGSPRPSTDMLR